MLCSVCVCVYDCGPGKSKFRADGWPEVQGTVDIAAGSEGRAGATHSRSREAGLFFSYGLQLVRRGPPTLWRVVCFPPRLLIGNADHVSKTPS